MAERTLCWCDDDDDEYDVDAEGKGEFGEEQVNPVGGNYISVIFSYCTQRIFCRATAARYSHKLTLARTHQLTHTASATRPTDVAKPFLLITPRRLPRRYATREERVGEGSEGDVDRSPSLPPPTPPSRSGKSVFPPRPHLYILLRTPPQPRRIPGRQPTPAHHHRRRHRRRGNCHPRRPF